jgi:G3E family GTPase
LRIAVVVNEIGQIGIDGELIITAQQWLHPLLDKQRSG